MPQFAHPAPWADVVWTLVIFLLFALAVRRWVLPQVFAALDARRKAIADEQEKLKRRAEAAARLKARYARKLAQAEREAEALLARAEDEARRLREARLAEARARIAQMKREAEEELHAEALRVQRALRKEAARLAVDAAEKLLQESIDEAKARLLTEKALQAIEALSQSSSANE